MNNHKGSSFAHFLVELRQCENTQSCKNVYANLQFISVDTECLVSKNKLLQGWFYIYTKMPHS